MGLELKSPIKFDVAEFYVRRRRFASRLSEEWEYQKHQGFLYLPIILALGIGLYYSLPVEPPLILGVFAVLSFAAMRVVAAYRFKLVVTVMLIVCLGFFAAQIRTYIVHAPIIAKEIGPTMVTGSIEGIEDLGEGKGARLILSDVVIEGIAPEKTPRKVRLKSRKDEGLKVGQRIEALSKIHPPSRPLIPGGFDFRQHLYFKQIGAVGFIYKDIKVLQDVSARSFTQGVERLRRGIGERVERAMHYPEAGVAVALMVGRKTAIAEKDSEAMRAAGLAHMLAISGLHIGLFSGALFFIIRLGLVCVPALALRHPVKKYAAVAAIIGAVIYMFMAGGSITTQRATLMSGIVFLAIILDRSPISLRLVAFAAFTVLLFFPESLLSASFHMSFAAVTCLIAFYSWLRPIWAGWHRKAGFGRRASLYFLGVCMTTVIATIATAPFALFHFNQLAAYGVLGNFIAMPLLAFIIMPSVLLSFVLMPVGLEFLPLKVTEFGIAGVLDIAHWVESLPQSVVRLSMWPQGALVMLILTGLAFILMRGQFKWVAVLPFMAALIMLLGFQSPDILVSEEGNLIALRDNTGRLQVSSLTSERFVRESWAELHGLVREDINKWPKEGVSGAISCGEGACSINLKSKTVSVIRNEVAAAELCANSDVVIADFPLYKLCSKGDRAHIIDLYTGRKSGAHAIWIYDGAVKIRTAAEQSGRRPWGSLNAAF